MSEGFDLYDKKWSLIKIIFVSLKCFNIHFMIITTDSGNIQDYMKICLP